MDTFIDKVACYNHFKDFTYSNNKLVRRLGFH